MQDELPGGIERLQADAKDAQRQIKDLQIKLAGHEADRLAAAATDGVVVAALDGWDQNALKTIASAIAGRPGHVAALLGGAVPFRGRRGTQCGSRDRLRRRAEAARGVDSAARAAAGLNWRRAAGLQGDPREIADYLRSLL